MAIVTPLNDTDFAQQILQILAGAHPTIDSETSAKVVDCYDGATREAPAGGLYSNLTNNWRAGSIPSGSSAWYVVELEAASTGAKCHVYVRMVTSNAPRAQMFPLGDFVAGGGSASSPTLPTVQTPLVDLYVANKTCPRSVVWSGGHIAAITLNLADASQTSFYLGEISALLSGSDWYRPFASFGNTFLFNSTNWRCASPYDDSTILSLDVPTIAVPNAGTKPSSILPILLTSDSAGHNCAIGFPIDVGLAPDLSTNTRYTFGLELGARDWVAFKGSSGDAMNATKHDGSALDEDRLRTRMPYELELPEPSPDTTDPVISNVTPSTGSALPPDSPIGFRVYDENLIDIIVMIYFPISDLYEVVHDGESFSTKYRGASTKIESAPGQFDFSIKRNTDWPETPILRLRPVDAGGNLGVVS